MKIRVSDTRKKERAYTNEYMHYPFSSYFVFLEFRNGLLCHGRYQLIGGEDRDLSTGKRSHNDQVYREVEGIFDPQWGKE
jgi:hypothetical protein